MSSSSMEKRGEVDLLIGLSRAQQKEIKASIERGYKTHVHHDQAMEVFKEWNGAVSIDTAIVEERGDLVAVTVQGVGFNTQTLLMAKTVTYETGYMVFRSSTGAPLFYCLLQQVQGLYLFYYHYVTAYNEATMVMSRKKSAPNTEVVYSNGIMHGTFSKLTLTHILNDGEQ